MEKATTAELPLHVLHVDKAATAINRAHFLLHSLLVSLFLYQRLSLLLLLLTQNDPVLLISPLLPSFLLLVAELVLSFLWLSEQAFRWRPVDRAVFIDRLPEDSSNRLPAVDVLICTADPDKEPTVEVMNTVLSAMALDYPIDKLHVYLSDDGGSSLTLGAIKEVWGFATWWVPFCRRYGVECRCPMAYFQDKSSSTSPSSTNTKSSSGADFVRDKLLIKEKYDLFKQRVEVNLLQQQSRETDKKKSRTDHPPLLQVINEKCTDPSLINPDCGDIPLLVYVAREKRPSHPHHFKAGALNVLLRVSGLFSNSPVVLVLDCDMYCNDPTSAKQAMCFYLDPEISSTLGFVQFPQRFHNLGEYPMYDDDFRWAFKVLLKGMDGLGTGPIMCGTGFYLNRKALYSDCVKGLDPVELRKKFGSSNEFIKTVSQDTTMPRTNIADISENILQEAEFVSSCSFDEETKWGDGLGFYYYSVAEDIFTGYNLQIRGWKSVYLDPQRASFLGSSTTNLNDMLTQNTRWTAGLNEIGLSRLSPLIYGPSRRNLPLLHRTCCAWFFLYSMNFLSVWCLAIIPPICLLHGIPIYPKVSSSLFPLWASLIFLSSQIKQLHEVLTSGGTIATWWNEQRTWIMKMLTCHTYGWIDAVMKLLGLKNTSFIPTNKFVDEDQAKRYRQGIHDFQASNMFLVPLGTVVILNLVCFVVGSVRMMVVGNWDERALQWVLSGFFMAMSKPVIEGMVVRRDRGRFPTSATLMSLVVCLVLLLSGPFIVLH